MKILILGHGRHGKDTAAEMLKDLFGFTFQSSSRAALDAIYPCLKASVGYSSKEEAFNDRSNMRWLWKELITLYNTPDKSALCRKILETGDTYVGMRCDKEYEASKELFDLILWVDRSVFLPTESSMLIKYNPDEMIFIDNNYDLENLRIQLDNLEVLF